MTENKTQQEAFLKQLKICLLIPDDEKRFWSEHMKILPESIVKKLTEEIGLVNQKMNEYVSAGFGEDKNVLNKLGDDLKRKLSMLKSLDEQQESEQAEEFLNQNIN